MTCKIKHNLGEKQEKISKPNPLTGHVIVQLLTAAITFKHRKHLVSGAIEDAVDGVHVDHLVGRVRSG